MHTEPHDPRFANTLSASAAAQAIRAGQLTSEQVVQACLERIANREHEVHAWSAIDPQAALACARARDRESPRSPLHGVPIGIKDVIDTADLPTEYNSPIYRGHYPSQDADIVARVRAAGMVVLGKTVTTEFATRGKSGATLNPHNPLYSPGGSSSGSAAAVADFMMPLAIGTQTAGSIIRPASYCGVIGFKPTFDALATRGMKTISHTLDTLGFHARTIPDAALVFSVLSNRPAPDFRRAAQPELTVAISRTPYWALAQAQTRDALSGAAHKLAAAGVHVSELPDSAPHPELGAALDLVSDYESWRHLEHERTHHADLLSEGVHEKLKRGAAISDARYREALQLIDECGKIIARLFTHCDCIVTPSAPGIAPLFANNTTGDAAFNKLWTALGLPCVGLPVPVPSGGMPVGVQVVAARGEDERALLAAHAIQRILTTPVAGQSADGHP